MPKDHHTECGYTARDYGAAALICHTIVATLNPTPVAAITFYPTADQAVAAAAHCRAPDSAGHQLIAHDQRGRVRVRRLDGPSCPTPPPEDETNDDR